MQNSIIKPRLAKPLSWIAALCLGAACLFQVIALLVIYGRYGFDWSEFLYALLMLVL